MEDDAPRGIDARVPFLLVTVSLLALCIAYRDSLAALEVRVLAGAVTATLLLAQQAVQRCTPRGVWSFSSVFLIVSIAFHAGLLLFLALGIRPFRANDFDYSWVHEQATKDASVLVTVGLLAFTISVLLVTAGTTSRERWDAVRGFNVPLTVVGYCILTLSVVAWAVTTASSLGPAFFLRSYAEYRLQSSGRVVPYSYLGVGLGLVLVVAGWDRRWMRRAFVVFIVFSVAALAVGLRSDVLFPLAAAGAVAARRRKLPNGAMVLVLTVVLLMSASTIQQVRQTGLGNLAASDVQASPVAGLAELGATLRTVSVVVQWHKYGHEPLRYGESYWAPMDRSINGRLLGKPMVDGREDRRLLNIAFLRREGPIGGSYIAEAYHNFGLGGVLLVPAFLGLALGCMDRRKLSAIGLALCAVVFVVLLRGVRNSFSPVPFQLVVGVLLVMVASVLTKWERPSQRRAQRQASAKVRDA